MKVIKPTTIAAGSSLVTSSTAAEPGSGETAWNAATNYTLGQRVIRTATHRVYENLIPGVDATAPESAPTRWLDVGPTNRWAMFDDVVGTATALAAGPLTVVLQPGIVSALALLELAGEQLQVTMRDGVAGPVVYDRTFDLEASVVTDWYEYFFEPFEQRSEVAVTDLPPYMSGVVTVTLTGSAAVAIGVLVIGTGHDIGEASMAATAGITDYSKKDSDPTYGTASLIERPYKKWISLQLLSDRVDFNRIFRLLATRRAKLSVWIPTEEDDLSGLLLYGFPRDFSLQIAYPTKNLCNLEIEGVI